MNKIYETDLLKYLTGSINKEEGNNDPLYNVSDYEINETLFNYVDDRVEGSFQIEGSVQCKDGKGQPNGKILYWGSNFPTENINDQQAFLLLTDYNLNPIALINTYSSGYPLFNIAMLDVAEDGNIYGLDYQVEENDLDLTYKFRIALFNNISEIPKGYSTYTCILRNSYYIQGLTASDNLNMIKKPYIKKSPQSATYFYSISNEEIGVTNMAGTFKINVGSANEWTRFPDVTFADYSTRVINAYFDGEDVVHATYYEPYINAGDDSAIFVTNTIGNSQPTSETIIDHLNTLEGMSGINDDYLCDIVPISNYFYLIIRGSVPFTYGGSDYYRQRVLIYVVNQEPTLLVNYEPTNYITEVDLRMPEIAYSLVNGNLIYYLYMMVYGDPGRDDIMFGFVNEKNDINILESTGAKRTGSFHVSFSNIISANNTYNLYSSSLYDYLYEDTTNEYGKVKTDLIYNRNNYNGEPYENIDSLVGSQGILLSDNKVVFARNLYNYKTYNNRVISTLNIPNNMLNDIPINTEVIIGKTNKDLLMSNQAITKNIYENLFINFFTSISMSNKNDDIEIQNKEGAIRLTQSAFNKNDYENAKATKAVINYDDGTDFTIDISPTEDYGFYFYNIGVYIPTDKNIETIDIKSNDLVTTYTTISNDTILRLNMTPGKYYYIHQPVGIENGGDDD